MKQLAIKTSRALCKEIAKGDRRPPQGYLGIDIIVSNDGEVVIEANSGAVGGFATLTKVKGRRLTDEFSTFLWSVGDFL